MSERAASKKDERQTLRLLKHLEPEGRYIVSVDAARCVVLSRRKGARKEFAAAKNELLEALKRRELVVPLAGADRTGGADAFVLSAIGRAFLKRSHGGEDAFAAQHRLLVPLKSPARRSVPVPDFNAAESPLSWLMMRKTGDGRSLLTREEFLAGERLRADFTLALMTPKTSTSWPLERVDCSRRANSSPAYDSDRANAARRRFWAALDAAGPELAQIVVGVCCHLQGLSVIEAKLDLPKRSGKAVLKLALSCLARHYGFAPRGSSRSRIRAESFGGLPPE